MHTRLITLLAAVLLFAIFIPVAAMATEPETRTHEFDITVTASSHLYVPLYPRAAHIRIMNISGTSITARFRQRIFTQSGTWNGAWLFSPDPRATAPSYITGTPYPAAADTTITIFSTTYLPWNVFNNIWADGIYFINGEASDRTVTVETMEK